MNPLHLEVKALARSYVGVRETAPNSNPANIDKWLAHVRCNPGDPYCAAFVSYCIHKAAATEPPTFRGSASALRLLARNEDLVVSPDEARHLLEAGELLVGILDMGGGKGHALLAVDLLEGDVIHSIEANTGPGPNVPAKDREGDGVYERTDRAFASVEGWTLIS